MLLLLLAVQAVVTVPDQHIVEVFRVFVKVVTEVETNINLPFFTLIKKKLLNFINSIFYPYPSP